MPNLHGTPVTAGSLTVWPVILAAVCAAGLLLAFQQVVQAGMLQGEARNRAKAALADAVWRCNYAIGLGQRESCHMQLNTSRQLDATLNQPGAATPETVSPRNR